MIAWTGHPDWTSFYEVWIRDYDQNALIEFHVTETTKVVRLTYKLLDSKRYVIKAEHSTESDFPILFKSGKEVI